MLMKMRSRMQNQKGFTLVELMVVVVILGILVAIAVPIYNNVTENAQTNACLANMRTIEGAAETWRAEQEPLAYPTTVAILVTDGFLKAEPICPLGTAKYTIDGDGNVTCPNTAVAGGAGHVLRPASVVTEP